HSAGRTEDALHAEGRRRAHLDGRRAPSQHLRRDRAAGRLMRKRAGSLPPFVVMALIVAWIGCGQLFAPKPPPDIASLSEQAAGPRMTMNSTGRMNRISGTVMIAGRRAAFSSARIMRSLRNSADR